MVGGLKSPHANVHGGGVPGQLGADVGLAPGWHPHHADDVLHAAAAGAVGGDLPLGLGHGHRKVTVCCYWSQWTRCRVTRLWGKWRGVERRAEWSCGVELVWDISHFTIPDSAPGCWLLRARHDTSQLPCNVPSVHHRTDLVSHGDRVF